MKKRRQEKGGEFLFRAWNLLSEGNLSGLRLYLTAVTRFGSSFEAVKKDLELAKRKGFLPQSFKIPESVGQLKKLVEGEFPG